MRPRITFVSAFALFTATVFASPKGELIPLGTLGDGTYYPSIAHAVSADGTIVTGFSSSPDGSQAFRWTKQTGMVGLGDLAGGFFYSEGFGISPEGAFIVGASDEGHSGGEGGAPMVWTQQNGMQFLGSLGGPLTYGQAMGCASSGSVIVGCSQSQAGIEAFRWTPSQGMMSIGDLPGGPVNARAMAVTPDGSMIVGYGSRVSTYDEAWYWTAATGMVGLGGRTSAALDVSDDGKVIVGVHRGFAFRWTQDGGFFDLPLVYGGFGIINYASACNSDGSVIVGLADYNATQGTGEAFIWDAVHGSRDLNVVALQAGIPLNGFRMFWARGISADGRTIVGYGSRLFGGQEAFYLRLPASPKAIGPGQAIHR